MNVTVSEHQVTFYACHKKTDLKVFVVVIPKKKDGHAWPHPSFFWYDTDFLEFESSDCIDQMGATTHAHPSFGMTTTKTLRSVFLWCASFYHA